MGMDCICDGVCKKGNKSYVSRFWAISFVLSNITRGQLSGVRTRCERKFSQILNTFSIRFTSSAIDKIFLQHTLAVRNEAFLTCIMGEIESLRSSKIARSFFTLDFDEILGLLCRLYNVNNMPLGRNQLCNIQYKFNLQTTIGRKIIKDNSKMKDCRFLIVVIRRDDSRRVVVACYCD